MIQTGIWKHYKGAVYQVLFCARQTETSEILVIYVPLYVHPDGGPAIQARPEHMWLEQVEWNGKMVPRFELLGPCLTTGGEQ